MTHPLLNRTALAGAALAVAGLFASTCAWAQKAAPTQTSAPACADCGTVIGVTARNRTDYNPKAVWVMGRHWHPTVFYVIDADSQKTPRFDVIVKLDDGTVVSFASPILPGWEAGERVRVENGMIAGR